MSRRMSDIKVFKDPMTLFPKSSLDSTSMKSNIPEDVNDLVDFKLEYNEIEARVYNVLHQFPKIDMKSFHPTMTFEQLKLDSLETIAVITAIERDFHTVFEENVFDNFETPQDVITFMTTNVYAF